MKSKKILLSFILALAMVVSVFPCCSVYAEGTVNSWGTNVTWTYANKTLSISGTGEIQSKGMNNYPWSKYADEVETVVIGEGITIIPNYAFYYSNLKSVSFPSTLKEIGQSAFCQCFYLESIVLPDGLEKIGHSAFYHAGSYTSNKMTMVLPSSLTEMDDPFGRATIITSFAIGSNASYKVVSGAVFTSDMKSLVAFPAGYEGTFNVPEGVETIDCGMGEAKNLTELNLPSTLIQINDGEKFFASISLSAINVAEGNQYFKSVNGVLFSKDQTKLILYPAAKPETTYTVPAIVTAIECNAFNCVRYLERLVVPQTVASVAGINYGYTGMDPFHRYWGNNLTVVGVPYSPIHEAALDAGHNFEALEGYTLNSNQCGANAFWSYDESTKTLTITGTGKAYYKDAWDSYKSQIKKAVISEGITELSNSFFRYWYSLETVDLPDTLTTLNGETFDYSGITSLHIPKNLTDLGAGSGLIGCASLASFTVDPENTAFTVSDGALIYKRYNSCDLIWYPSVDATNVAVPNGVKTIGWYGWTFYNNPNLKTIYIPKSVNSIAENGFYNVVSLEAIYYEGTQAEWEAIGSSTYNNWYQQSNLYRTPVYYTTSRAEYIEATAEEHVLGDIIWTFKNGVLTFKGTGEVGGYAFDSHETPWDGIMPDIKEIVFEDGITTISGLALYQQAVNLEKITISKSVVSIGHSVFSRLESLTEFVVDSANNTFTAYDGVLYSKDMKMLIQYPCGKVGAYVMPSTVEQISSSEVFGIAEKLTSVSIPAGFVGDLTGDFHFNTSLSSIIVDANNTMYKSVDGVLYSKDGTKLYCYPAGKEGITYTVLDGTQEILYCAFHSCEKLQKVYVPNTITDIDYRDLYSEVNFVFEDSSKCGMDAYWTYADGVLTISGTGTLFPYYGNSGLRPWQDYINDIDTIVIKEGITQIPDGVFLTFNNNVDVFIPSSLVSLEYDSYPQFNIGKSNNIFYAGSKTGWSEINGSEYCCVNRIIFDCVQAPVSLDYVDGKIVKTGTEFKVTVTLGKSTIFNNLALQIGYDTSKLELAKVEINYTGGSITTSEALATTPYVIMWTSGNHLVHGNRDVSGKNPPIATLTFKVKEDATLGDTTISVDYFKGRENNYVDGVNVNYNEAGPLEMSYQNCTVKVTNFYPGDIDKDNIVDSHDVIALLNYIVGNSVDVNTDAVDYNLDGICDTRDAVALMRKIVGGTILF